MMSLASIHRYLFERVDNSGLVLFRIFFGLLIFLEVVGAFATGWIHETFVAPRHALPFIGFEWLTLPSPTAVYIYYGLIAVAGLCIMLGLYYRIATIAFTFLWWGCYLMQKVHYNNHYYLLILLGLFLAVVPAQRYRSLDVRRNPATLQHTCPRWCVLIFCLQVGLVFTYASLAKLYPDWLAGKPIAIWFDAKAHYPVLGPLFGQAWFRTFIIYGGIFFDLLITPLLLWRRTRVLGFVLCVIFNVFNSITFQIGGFPYLMIALTLFFFPPETIRKIFFRKKEPAQFVSKVYTSRYKNVVTAALVLYFTVQLLLPLRHFLFPGSVFWTEEGHRMAWHMMLRTKSGRLSFKARTADGQIIPVQLRDYFTPLQIRAISRSPDMIWQAAKIILRDLRSKGYTDVALYVQSEVSLNGGPLRPFVDPKADFATISWRSFQRSTWILD
ncbi:HTTM domain-containing protein [Fulvivirgaceae bacterium PWU5]|uniref:HTTM domain-containing protein n=1 Tax=Dawidia cretensis TaxID=2782350 RepID=A0AAP2DUU2_9BACT|nr:HTTM domain-containing protein [Dawidia cretensis]MBT1707858.1 HTTM domain-containing protein [Dawidia cretensis]